MGLRIVYGKAGSGKSWFCFSEISKLLDTEENILIITPEQFSFTAEKKLMEVTKNGAVLNAEVLTLSRMAYRVIQEVGNNNVSSLSSIPAKAMLVNFIIDKNKEKLKFLNKSQENVDMVIQAITEFKKHKVSVDDLKQMQEKLQDEYLKYKLQDMTLLYEGFESSLANKLLDDTDLLTYLENNIEKTDIVKDAIIYIDEFMGFTKQEYAVIAKLIKLAKQVTITLCIDKLQPSANPVTDIFYSNKKTLSKLLQVLEENNLKLDEPIPTVYEKNVENIELFLAKNQYTEIENVARKIVDLIKNNNYRYNEISVITKDLNQYSSLIRAIFAQYDIPVFIDEKRDLNQNIVIKYILAVLDVLNKNYSFEAVISYLKSGFIDLDDDERFDFENYCTKWGIKYNKWKQDFKYGKKNNENYVKRMDEIRQMLINPLVDLKEKLQKDRSAKSICLNIYNFLANQKIEEKLQTKIDELTKLGQVDLANEYKKSYEIIIGLLDDIVNVFDEEKMSITAFTNYFRIGLKNSSLGKIPGTQDQVIVGDVDRSRSHKVKATFIIGINDGVFPSNNRDEGFLNDADRDILKQNGMELANGTIDNLYEENFNIYKAFTTPEERLYLSYASSDSNGKSLRPSMLIYKLKKKYPKLVEQSDVVTKKYEIINYKVTYEELLEQIFMLQSEGKMGEIWYAVYQYYKKNNQDMLENDLLGLDYTNQPKDISKEIIDKLYGNTLNTSVSKLEKYRNCPFSYYLQYGLNLKEKEELKVQSFNTGTFMHETIDKFFECVREENLELPAFLEDEQLIENLVSKIIEEELDLVKNEIFTATTKYKLLVRRLKRVITKALKYIIEGLVYSKFDIAGTEVEFGKNGKYKPIILNLEDGKRIEITGKIDRIDTAQDSSGRYLRIIDYKSSARNVDLDEVYDGIQIQLLTYLDAVCKQEDLEPAGILYFGLLEQMIKTDKKMSKEEIENEIRKNFKMKGLIVADVNIIKLHDKTLTNGTSNLVPAGITASGEINKRYTSGINKEEFKKLQDDIFVIIKDIAKEILQGKIDIKPYKKKEKDACKYCAYKSICGK